MVPSWYHYVRDKPEQEIFVTQRAAIEFARFVLPDVIKIRHARSNKVFILAMVFCRSSTMNLLSSSLSCFLARLSPSKRFVISAIVFVVASSTNSINSACFASSWLSNLSRTALLAASLSGWAFLFLPGFARGGLFCLGAGD